jgi:hypothetical protein
MVVILLLIAGVLLSACGPTGSKAASVKPALVEEIQGSVFKRVTLTEKAAERLDIQTAPVREEQVNGAQRLVVPYAAVIYGLEGETWAYTNLEPLVFVRQPIQVDRIQGDLAILSEGPAVGTPVVTVGVAELYGAETGVSK